MTATCSFCVQETEGNLLAVSSKMPAARICDKCLFKEMAKLFTQELNLGTAIERLEKEHRALLAQITSAVEARVQALNTSALALDSELVGLRDMKRQLQETLKQAGVAGTAAESTSGAPHEKKPDLRVTAVKRLVDERMNPGSLRAPEGGAAATGS